MKKLLMLVCVAMGIVAMAEQKYELTPEYKLRLAEQVIENFYVDQPDTSKMVEQAIIAMLKTLDPHSAYSTPDETKELTEPLEGNFSGIGIRYQVQQDTVTVIETVVGGPSEAVGLRPGDKIISCNDSVIAGLKMTNSQVTKVLRGPKGSKALLKVKRRNEPELLEFTVRRDDIPIYSVDAKYMIDSITGYIKLSRFAQTTTMEMVQAMDTLLRQGMENVIIDVTDNGGGYMNPAYEIASMFLKKGSKLVYTESPRLGRDDYDATRDGFFLDGNVVIMANQYSASASEILSGALQDNDRGVVVGRRTFGKGLVQRPFPFPDGSMIRLTVSRYHTPSGRCIQKPYKDGDDKAYENDIVSRLSSGELIHPDSIHMADSLLTYTLKLKRPIYGGGGIVPDVFVAMDTTSATPYYRNIVAKGVLASFCFNYTQEHKSQFLDRYVTLQNYMKEYTPGPDMFDALKAAAEKEKIKTDSLMTPTEQDYISVIMKGLIARDIWGQDAYYRIANEINPIYKRAIEVSRDVTPYLKPETKEQQKARKEREKNAKKKK